jgi:hypothetical protein
MLLAKNRGLVHASESVSLWHFPPEIFDLFKKTYVLTYFFKGQIMKYYFDYHAIQYDMKQVVQNGERFHLAPYNPEGEHRGRFKSLVNICNMEPLNKLGEDENSFSKNWYKKKNKDDRIFHF